MKQFDRHARPIFDCYKSVHGNAKDAVASRIDVHIERLNCHPMDIRKYYRQLEY
ncbi:MAG TPA: hypothetical protein GX688_00720 [Clostridiales bacterium]|nr:hypothetical protein [Clostridiales bacterium]